jgi:hypothetical protein
MYSVAQSRLSAFNYITFTATLLLKRLLNLENQGIVRKLYRPFLAKAGRLDGKLLIHLSKIRCNGMSNTVAPL